jgi:hypothetical protein
MGIKRLAPVCLAVVCIAAAAPFAAAPSAAPFYRNPVVLSVAPDEVDCDNPDDPDNVEDVQIAGLCFFGDITAAYLTLEPDGSGTQYPLTNVVNVARNIVTATVPLASLTQRDQPYYLFLVRGTDGKRSTSYPNAFGFDVTFSCTTDADPPSGDAFPHITSARVVRASGGRFVLEVTGTNFRAGSAVVLVGGEPCAKTKYPKRHVDADGFAARVDCHDNLRRLLPATITVRDSQTGAVSDNSVAADF